MSQDQTTEAQPISTAPRDGRQILLWVPPCVQALSGAWVVASWHAGAWHTPYFVEPTLWAPLLEVPR
jgi:hypothetical protein